MHNHPSDAAGPDLRRSRISHGLLAALAAATLTLSACGGGDDREASQVPPLPLDPQLLAAGQQTFRHDTFGDVSGPMC